LKIGTLIQLGQYFFKAIRSVSRALRVGKGEAVAAIGSVALAVSAKQPKQPLYFALTSPAFYSVRICFNHIILCGNCAFPIAMPLFLPRIL